MASHLSAIGFPVETEAEFRELVARAAAGGVSLPGGTYSRWAPGEGIELWVQLGEREVVGFNPHFAGSGRMRVAIQSVRPEPAFPSEGKVYGWADPRAGQPDGGAYPLIFDLPDFATAVAQLQPRSTVTIQLAAFAHDLTCYASDDAFAGAQGEVKFAPESFVPAGLFDSEGGEVDEPEALALVSGHVRAARVAVNPVTGRSFHILLVQTVGGTVDLVADPASVIGAPVVGGVVQGTFWLSGRIVPEPNRRGIFPLHHS